MEGQERSCLNQTDGDLVTQRTRNGQFMPRCKERPGEANNCWKSEKLKSKDDRTYRETGDSAPLGK